MHDFQILEIVEVKRETPEAISVTLRIPDALREVFRFKPGQHLTLRTTLEGEEQRRTYSICCGPGRRICASPSSACRGTLLELGQRHAASGRHAGGDAADGALRSAARRWTSRQIVGLSAGAGITPIMAMLKQALAAEPNTSFTLIYGNRAPQSILFREELEDLKDRHLGRFTLLHVLSRTRNRARRCSRAGSRARK